LVHGLPGAQSCPLVSYRIVGIEALVTAIQQMDSPGIGVAVILCGDQIAVGQVGIDTGQDGLIAWKISGSVALPADERVSGESEAGSSN